MDALCQVASFPVNKLDINITLGRIEFLHLYKPPPKQVLGNRISSDKIPRPFLKWAGGKRQLLPELHKRLPAPLNSVRKYFEIFGGGAAFLFSLKQSLPHTEFFLSDKSQELINTFEVVRDHVDELIEDLGRHQNTKEYYYEMRAWDRRPEFHVLSKVKRASRLIYLNKTGYNGLHRVNSRGEFNVPFGSYANPNVVDADNLRACSIFLQRVQVRLAHYTEVVTDVGRGDFLYLDPPYEPVSSSSNFRGYTEFSFDEVEQTRLFKFCQVLHKQKALFMLSNSSAPWVVELYRKEKSFNVELVQAKRAINSNAKRRGMVCEIIVRNYG